MIAVKLLKRLLTDAKCVQRGKRRTTALLAENEGVQSCVEAAMFNWALTLPRRHTPKAPTNKVSSLVRNWHTPKDSLRLLSPWDSDFTQGITPLPCHSHNDYWRTVPLFEALAAGCMSVEADIYLPTKAGSEDLLVGHSSSSLTQDRTLQSLYTGPLITILGNLNNRSSNSGSKDGHGIFQSSPNTTFTLFLDFKSDGTELWPYVNRELEDLRARNWLTHWTNLTGITWSPIIVVASGNAPFNLIRSNNTYRDIFYDAPLDDITNSIYDQTNSYYASVSLSKVIGKQWLWRFSSTQLDKISAQISAASEKGLKSRYWDTPSWPVTFRDYVWGVLIENGVGMLNVDVFPSTVYFPLLTRFGQNRLVW
ncbi:Altered inheritance of mitochondria protein 6 [Ciborinia camelliae]|nr:Altered inheritance of mitochondria protein 6 [Ciborinia camelliae]